MQQFEHYNQVDASAEWKKGPIGWFLRVRGIISAVVTDSIGSLLAFLYLHWVVGVLILAAGVLIFVILLLFRHFLVQRIETDIALHAFCHKLRDDSAQIMRLPSNESSYRHALDSFHTASAQGIASFFRLLIGDKTVNCAIRLAEEHGGKQVYVTRARSDGMDPSRSEGSQPIPSNEGIAAALRQKEKRGVFIIPSIDHAAKCGLWKKTPTDDLLDVKSLMVAPINGWENGSKVMLGILYVTSSRKTVPFQARHTLSMKALADMLGLAYPPLFGRVQ